MKIMFVSLGCDKNLVDTENMLGILKDKGYEFTDDEYEAEAIVVNTCCFIHDAKEESIETLIEMGQRKLDGKCKILVAAGCLAHRYQDELIKEIPEVDAFIGTTSFDKIAEAIENVAKNQPANIVDDNNRLPQVESKRIISTPGYFEYLKIAEGCDKRCTYCVIPYVRGSFRSYPVEYLVNQAKHLVENGASELILVAQETTLYGVDLYGKKSLPMLLHELSKIEDLKWIRILYCYPEEIDDELIQAIKNEPKVCHYLDLPIQSGADNVLKRMGRRTSRQDIIDIVKKLRQEIPDIALRTTLITGFPGESQKDFETTYNFVDELEFDRLGVFTYSMEEGTPAAKLKDQIPEEVKASRRDEIMELQQEISIEKSQAMIGKELEVLIEGYIPDDDTYVGRSYKDAPNVDGLVFVSCDYELISGSIVKVKITDATEYDLLAEIMD
ncbi:30S ribosomal protein S12 methylthiotransferase RimO [Lachnospira pectinoschiza]|uniref:Ribosomal protein uS12 methylthiotransferase RimO n=1 Tax=Lachnospira pectinoschiza TaxID=28052 RepID=A0A1G9VQ57_9FIRM|nr:30S ribosomal protein S12 methylthiotransferase RimO [Lachnospira pectinoschiza]SDM74352.1 ribosomal protein S12 methylthiotransferase [Lachnospira pectinoschiza]